MGKDRSDKEKKEKKKEKKRSESDGVHKKSKDKKDKKKIGEQLERAIQDELSSKALEVSVSESKAPVASEEGETVRPVGALAPFAHPLAADKVAKKVLKTVKKAAVNKSLRRGVKEVVKGVRKSAPATDTTNPPAIVILAADISPIDVISHIPVLCEDHGIPYIFVSSRAELGVAGATKRPTSVVMIHPRVGKNKKDSASKDDDDFSELYKELVKVVQKESKKVKI